MHGAPFVSVCGVFAEHPVCSESCAGGSEEGRQVGSTLSHLDGCEQAHGSKHFLFHELWHVGRIPCL